MNLQDDVSIIKGVGEKLTQRLNKCGIFTILDLLLYFPRDYDFLKSEIDLSNINSDEKQILKVTCTGFDKDIKTKNYKTITTIRFKCNNNLVIAKWFNQPFIKHKFKFGFSYDMIGKFKNTKGTLEVINPLVSIGMAKQNKIIPKYALKDNLSEKVLVKIINSVLEEVHLVDNLPQNIIDKYNLIDLEFALKNIHFPKGKDELEKSIIRLKFQELFNYSMKLLLIKNKIKSQKGISFKLVEELKNLKDSLPYSLTDSQINVIREIFRDQKSNYPMNRLVQGDVGSGAIRFV